jgi:hypothetical protein
MVGGTAVLGGILSGRGDWIQTREKVLEVWFLSGDHHRKA